MISFGKSMATVQIARHSFSIPSPTTRNVMMPLVAFIAGNGTTPQQIWQSLMASGLPKLWIPKPDDIRMIESLPMLGTGKVDLRAIRQVASAA
jgi:acyl-[acyl-carrier-protein]-phospholipid O-acyltransferase/long-chain-fatty-acid--[acyl-carrier-protein] ligase